MQNRLVVQAITVLHKGYETLDSWQIYLQALSLYRATAAGLLVCWAVRTQVPSLWRPFRLQSPGRSTTWWCSHTTWLNTSWRAFSLSVSLKTLHKTNNWWGIHTHKWQMHLYLGKWPIKYKQPQAYSGSIYTISTADKAENRNVRVWAGTFLFQSRAGRNIALSCLLTQLKRIEFSVTSLLLKTKFSPVCELLPHLTHTSSNALVYLCLTSLLFFLHSRTVLIKFTRSFIQRAVGVSTHMCPGYSPSLCLAQQRYHFKTWEAQTGDRAVL